MMDEKTLRKHRAKLDKALAANRDDEAIQLLAGLVSAEPTNARWPHKRGDLLRKVGRRAEAVAAYEQAVDVYAQTGFIARAVAMAKTVLSLDPSRTDVLMRVDPQAAQQLHRQARPASIIPGAIRTNTNPGTTSHQGGPGNTHPGGRHPAILDEASPVALALAAARKRPVVVEQAPPEPASEESGAEDQPMIVDDDESTESVAVLPVGLDASDDEFAVEVEMESLPPARHAMVLDDEPVEVPKKHPMVLDDDESFGGPAQPEPTKIPGRVTASGAKPAVQPVAATRVTAPGAKPAVQPVAATRVTAPGAGAKSAAQPVAAVKAVGAVAPPAEARAAVGKAAEAASLAGSPGRTLAGVAAPVARAAGAGAPAGAASVAGDARGRAAPPPPPAAATKPRAAPPPVPGAVRARPAPVPEEPVLTLDRLSLPPLRPEEAANEQASGESKDEGSSPPAAAGRAYFIDQDEDADEAMKGEESGPPTAAGGAFFIDEDEDADEAMKEALRLAESLEGDADESEAEAETDDAEEEHFASGTQATAAQLVAAEAEAEEREELAESAAMSGAQRGAAAATAAVSRSTATAAQVTGVQRAAAATTAAGERSVATAVQGRAQGVGVAAAKTTGVIPGAAAAPPKLGGAAQPGAAAVAQPLAARVASSVAQPSAVQPLTAAEDSAPGALSAAQLTAAEDAEEDARPSASNPGPGAHNPGAQPAAAQGGAVAPQPAAAAKGTFGFGKGSDAGKPGTFSRLVGATRATLLGGPSGPQAAAAPAAKPLEGGPVAAAAAAPPAAASAFKPPTAAAGIEPPTAATGIKPPTAATGIKPPAAASALKPPAAASALKPPAAAAGIKPPVPAAGMKAPTPAMGIKLPTTASTGIKPAAPAAGATGIKPPTPAAGATGIHAPSPAAGSADRSSEPGAQSRNSHSGQLWADHSGGNEIPAAPATSVQPPVRHRGPTMLGAGPKIKPYEPPPDEAELFSRALEAAIELKVAPDQKPNETRFSNSPPGPGLELSTAEVSDRPEAALNEEHDAVPHAVGELSNLPLFPLFAEMPQEALGELITDTELIELSDGDIVIRKGDPGDALFGIVEGSVMVVVPNHAQGLTLAEGDVFGESCLLQDEPRHADVRVVGRLTALKIPRHVLTRALRRYPQLAELLLELLTRRLLANLLQTSPLFSTFDAEGRRELSRMFEVRRAPAGTKLSIAGKLMDGLYISLTGTLAVETPGEAPRIAPPGSMFGHTLLSREPASTSVTARVNLVVLRLPATAFAHMAMEYPTIVEHLAELSTSDVVSVSL